jgi:hypothetical protein
MGSAINIFSPCPFIETPFSARSISLDSTFNENARGSDACKFNHPLNFFLAKKRKKDNKARTVHYHYM